RMRIIVRFTPRHRHSSHLQMDLESRRTAVEPTPEPVLQTTSLILRCDPELVEGEPRRTHQTRSPAALLNGSRVCPRFARLPGMTAEREALPGVAAGEAHDRAG